MQRSVAVKKLLMSVPSSVPRRNLIEMIYRLSIGELDSAMQSARNYLKAFNSDENDDTAAALMIVCANSGLTPQPERVIECVHQLARRQRIVSLLGVGLINSLSIHNFINATSRERELRRFWLPDMGVSEEEFVSLFLANAEDEESRERGLKAARVVVAQDTDFDTKALIFTPVFLLWNDAEEIEGIENPQEDCFPEGRDFVHSVLRETENTRTSGDPARALLYVMSLSFVLELISNADGLPIDLVATLENKSTDWMFECSSAGFPGMSEFDVRKLVKELA